MKRHFRATIISGIQFITSNGYGEFSFYVTEEELQRYLDQLPMLMSLDHFKSCYNHDQSRALFEWIKKSKNENKDPTST